MRNIDQVRFIHDIKIEAIKEIVDEAQGDPILLFYNYKHEFERLKKAFPHIKTLDTQADRRAWNAGSYPLAGPLHRVDPRAGNARSTEVPGLRSLGRLAKGRLASRRLGRVRLQG